MERGIKFPWTEYPCVEIFNYVDAICLPQLFSVIAMMNISFYSDLFYKILVFLLFSWKVEIQQSWYHLKLPTSITQTFQRIIAGWEKMRIFFSGLVLLLPPYLSGWLFFSLFKITDQQGLLFFYFSNLHERTLGIIVLASRPHKRCKNLPALVVR